MNDQKIEPICEWYKGSSLIFSHTEDKAKWSSEKRDSMTKGYWEGSGPYVSWQLKEYNHFFFPVHP